MTFAALFVLGMELHLVKNSDHESDHLL